MEQVLQGVPKTQCLLDDIIVAGATEDEYLRIIEEVLAWLDQYGMTLNKATCAFLKSQIEFCGRTTQVPRENQSSLRGSYTARCIPVEGFSRASQLVQPFSTKPVIHAGTTTSIAAEASEMDLDN